MKDFDWVAVVQTGHNTHKIWWTCGGWNLVNECCNHHLSCALNRSLTQVGSFVTHGTVADEFLEKARNIKGWGPMGDHPFKFVDLRDRNELVKGLEFIKIGRKDIKHFLSKVVEPFQKKVK